MVSSRPLRVDADATHLPDGLPHTMLLYPFWGAPASDPASPTSGRFDGFVANGPRLVELTGPEEADLTVLPVAWEHLEALPDAQSIGEVYAERARGHGIPLVVFYVSDSEASVPVEDAWVYRTSLRRSRRAPRELAMPALSMDVARQELGGDVHPRKWTTTPTVGFCGYAPGAETSHGARALARAAKRRLRVARGDLPDGIYARARALGVLEGSDRVRLAAVVRDAFWAGAVVPGQPNDYGLMATARRDFVANLRESDYVLCARGGGNFSYRLYEALSAGRIPLFVDTDCVLPFEDEIDWHALCVWVDEAEIEHAADAVADFHAALGPAGFVAAQRECRRVWEEYLSPEGFFGRFGRAVLARAAA
jgi:hypothetical protein